MIKDVEKIFDLAKSEKYHRLFRINYNGLRLYINNNPFAYYSGLTGALEAATFKGDPASKRLNKWREGMIEKMGQENTYNWVKMTADFGTLLHEALVRIKDNGQIIWKEEEEIAIEYFKNSFEQKGVNDLSLVRKATYEYQKHVGSLMQFVYERVHEIQAIEVPAIWKELNIATPIDLVCTARQTPKGEFMKSTINIKTSKQITPHHLEQASCELIMWNQTYEDEKAMATGILRTKDWTEGKTPTFDYKYHKFEDARVKALAAYRRMELCLQTESSYFPEPKSKSFQGTTKLGEAPDIAIHSIEEDWGREWELMQLVEKSGSETDE